jgi:hypothetical protein
MRCDAMRRGKVTGLDIGGHASSNLASGQLHKRQLRGSATCESIGRAIAAAHGPIGPVEDRTAKSQELATKGTLPYSILRMCLVTIPGQRLPIRVGVDGASHQFLMKMMTQMAAVRGHGIRKLDGASYGDLAYLLPQDAGGYAIDAVVGDMGLNIAYMPDAQDVQNMAEHVIRKFRLSKMIPLPCNRRSPPYSAAITIAPVRRCSVIRPRRRYRPALPPVAARSRSRRCD